MDTGIRRPRGNERERSPILLGSSPQDTDMTVDIEFGSFRDETELALPNWRDGRRYTREQLDGEALGGGFHVYSHEDQAGRIFYVGVRGGRSGWAPKNDALWERFVATRLESGQYWVRLIAKGLEEEEALELSNALQIQLRKTIINGWTLDGGIDEEAYDRHNERVSHMALLMSRAKASRDKKEALELLKQAIELHYEASKIRYETGIRGELKHETGTAGLGCGVVDKYRSSGSFLWVLTCSQSRTNLLALGSQRPSGLRNRPNPS